MHIHWFIIVSTIISEVYISKTLPTSKKSQKNNYPWASWKMQEYSPSKRLSYVKGKKAEKQEMEILSCILPISFESLIWKWYVFMNGSNMETYHTHVRHSQDLRSRYKKMLYLMLEAPATFLRSFTLSTCDTHSVARKSCLLGHAGLHTSQKKFLSWFQINLPKNSIVPRWENQIIRRTMRSKPFRTGHVAK